MRRARDSILKRGSIPVAVLLVFVVLLSASSGLYAGASFFAQQAPNVTVTTTILTTTTSWTTSTIWSTVTAVILGVWTTVQYTTSTSTVTVTGTTSSRAAKIVTARGNAQISAAQSKFGGTSGLFHGTGDYLSIPNSADFSFTGDLTIDFWIRLASIGATIGIYSQSTDGTHLVQLAIAGVGTSLLLQEVGGGGVVQQWRWIPSTNTWYHVAICRSGSAWYAFVNGTALTNITNANPAGAVGGFSGSEYIGVLWNLSGGLNGWLDEFHISKGVARWTSNFTPPTSAPTGDSNTVLLLHMDGADGSNTFIDG